MNVEEAKQFFAQVKTLSKSLTLNATASHLKMNLATFNSRLIKASSMLGLSIPVFSSRLSGSKAKERETYIQASGRGGVSKKIVIPQQFFTQLGWDINDPIKIKTTGSKIVIEKMDQKEE